jgi:NADH-quinone oxidoreductase subunit H
MFCVVPIGGTVSILGHETQLQVADLPIGALWILAMSGIGVYGVMLAGWSSGSKYPLLGAVRASAQLLSYEAAFGLAVLGVLVRAGTLSTGAIVEQQAWTDGFKSIGTQWFLFPAIVSFFIFLIAATAETNHPPFDLVEAEQELVGGFHTEYTGIRFAIFFLAEFMNVITMSAVATTLFLGGPSGPSLGFLSDTGTVNVWVMPIFWFTVKVLGLLYLTVWVRASLPRIRYDRLMAIGWKFLIEAAILWVLVSVAVEVIPNDSWSGMDRFLLALGLSAGVGLVSLVLWLSVPKAGESIEEFH